MISVERALESLLSLVGRLPSETVSLRAAAGRALAGPLKAVHDQPPFAASAMDGYAIARDVQPGDTDRVIGESAAGHPFDGTITADSGAVRIFTGAPVPAGATRVILQENISRVEDRITYTEASGTATHVRPAGGDFTAGEPHDPKRPLGSRDIALIAAMGHGAVPVVRKPLVAILMTGDELRAPGERLHPGQITASNGYGLAAMFDAAGAETRVLPIAQDTAESLGQAFRLAEGADLLITIGGASVGDHDLIAPTAGKAGLDLAFHKVAMRPGKPLLAGKINGLVLVGLPGNPVSAIACGTIFILPMLRKMLGLPIGTPTEQHRLAAAVSENGPRQHYMRAQLTASGMIVADRQDSSLLSVLAKATHLVIRPPHDPARNMGDVVTTIALPP
ncbi:molybdopterin molybdotransferase [Jannaschia faecimaris]|uniref:Molybdopterin molybdenumtransferase n=1 Tax=Jannaschia faecimaris TaxID=1244108 RepID=A0A1H3P124_9RHOB|nr:molybdopterin molybdotransferase MoeA [Jannaschia faecimaris]SDY94826.1 molybdopterin molybdotransferase [Jannaschia faecimaris]